MPQPNLLPAWDLPRMLHADLVGSRLWAAHLPASFVEETAGGATHPFDQLADAEATRTLAKLVLAGS